MKRSKKKKMTEEQREAWVKAVRDNDIKTVQKMLKEGFDVNIATTYSGWTALHYACYFKHLKMAKLLIKNGADVTAKNNVGYAPLDKLNRKNPQKYEELMEWLSEEYPDKALEVMANENSQSKSIGL